MTVLASCSEVLELCRVVPELQERVPRLTSRTAEFCGQALKMIVASAEGTEFEEGLRMDGLVGLASNVEEELGNIRELLEYLASIDPSYGGGLRDFEQRVREQVADALRRRASAVFHRAGHQGEVFETLSAESRKLGQLEHALSSLSARHVGLRQELLAPVGHAYVRGQLSNATFTRVEQLSRVVTQAVEALRREGVQPGPALAESRDVLEARLKAYALNLAQGLRSLPPPPAALNAEAYNLYRERYSGQAVPDGELAALVGLEAQLAALQGQGAPPSLSPQVREALANAELTSLQNRVSFLRAWLQHIFHELPATQEIRERIDADRAFDKLVKTRFPLLAMKEGEFIRLHGALATLAKQGGEVAAHARKLEEALEALSDGFSAYSKRLLEIRANL